MKDFRKIIRKKLIEGIFDDGNPDRSWLAGKYTLDLGDGNPVEAEVNTQLPYLAVGNFFAQGEEADNFIDEIHAIWLKNDCTEEEAIKKWAGYYLSSENI
jgi:hypothetical protein